MKENNLMWLLSTELNRQQRRTLLLVFVSLVAIILPAIIKRRLKKVCTQTVTATIIRYKIYRNGYYPVYRINYNNKEYEISDKSCYIFKIRPIGMEVELKINPDNPEEILGDRIIYFYMFQFVGIFGLILSALMCL